MVKKIPNISHVGIGELRHLGFLEWSNILVRFKGFLFKSHLEHPRVPVFGRITLEFKIRRH